ncbi:MAG TPA: hypothetical protein VIU14_12990 [Mesorhizobium sp.]|jgi:hypothetical protein
MENLIPRFRSFAIAACGLAFAWTNVLAAPAILPQATPALVLEVQADCYSIGQQIAAENGGTLARASASNQGGREVCVIVVLVPGKNGQRPRRAQFIVPAN